MNENLTAVQSALKALQDKYDKVLKFIEKLQLKEKLEEFLKPVIHHRISLLIGINEDTLKETAQADRWFYE